MKGPTMEPQKAFIRGTGGGVGPRFKSWGYGELGNNEDPAATAIMVHFGKGGVSLSNQRREKTHHRFSRGNKIAEVALE